MAMQMRKTNIPGDEIFIVDDDPWLGDLLADILQSDGYYVTCFKDEETFTSVARLRTPACILLDIYMPRRSGLEVLRDLDPHNYAAPIVVMSGRANISLAVEATKIGAFDVVEKPFDPDGFSAHLRQLIDAWRRRQEENAAPAVAADFPGRQRLTQREREVLAEIAAASSNKEAAAHLGLSPRTVEVHRAHIMMKLGTKNTADLLRLVMGNKQIGNRKLT
jgi:two-component system, LuxR family, response regulator FixJ